MLNLDVKDNSIRKSSNSLIKRRKVSMPPRMDSEFLDEVTDVKDRAENPLTAGAVAAFVDT
ncbi:hypothetical protein FRB95_012607 [Tulasnella sp. JGI-2019a]|nr:hypothetical protein FRB95_012607 [Tulasnella sp. JGI-2019a]